jgi:outer membrane protein OmpA-like peptidoglycan-associated protein
MIGNSRDGFLIGIGALLLLAASGSAWAQHPGGSDGNGVVSAEDILRQLTPPIRTRGLHRANVPEQAAAVSLSIPFDSNSSRLQPAASKQLHNLADALNSDDLKSSRFEVAGHTDATGNAAYNKRLSTRRALAVKEFLVHLGVSAKRIETAGYGSEHLLKPDAPLDPANRRVEIRNLGEDPAASGQ